MCGVILKYITLDGRVVLQAGVQLLAMQLGLSKTRLLVSVQGRSVLKRVEGRLVIHVPERIGGVDRLAV